jgi:Ca2+-binding RTX toxin-like protein
MPPTSKKNTKRFGNAREQKTTCLLASFAVIASMPDGWQRTNHLKAGVFMLIIGTSGNDTLNGTTSDDEIHGLEGNDSINGLAGNDLIYGNQGNDTVHGDDGNDTIYGGQGNDGLFGDAGNDVVYGNFGDDGDVIGGTGNDTLYGGQGNDGVAGGDGADLMYGNLGNDFVTGGAGNDTLYGGQGNDEMGEDDAGNDIVYGNFGNDTIGGGLGDNTVYGGQGDDVILESGGATNSDRLFGNLGADTFDFSVTPLPPSGQMQATADHIADFSDAQNDRVNVNPINGVTYAESQGDASVVSVETAISWATSHNLFSSANTVFVAGVTDGYLLVDANSNNAFGSGDYAIVLDHLNSTTLFGPADVI